MKNSARVLLVDDDRSSLTAHARHLKQAGHDVLTAGTGKEALKLWRKKLPDLVLLDVYLPDGDGLKICSEMKEAAPDSTGLIVLFSAKSVESESQSQGLEAGADGYIAFPIPKREFLARVDTFLRLRFAIKERDEAIGKVKGLYDSIREELERQESYQFELLGKISDAVISTDEKFRILSWNTAAEKIYGRKESDVKGKPFGEVIPTRYPDSSAEEVLAEFTNTGSWQGEVIQVNAMQEDLHILSSVTALTDMKGTIKGAVAVNRDITGQKQLLEQLKLSEEYYRLLFNMLPYGGEVLDREGTIIRCSPSTEKLLEYKTDELIGKHITELLTEESVFQFKQKFPKLLQGEAQTADISMVHKNGRVVDVMRAAQPIRNKDGNVESILALNIDMTERNTARKELEKYQTTLEEMIVARTKELQEKNAELERYNDAFVGRELRMKELFDENQKLKDELKKKKE